MGKVLIASILIFTNPVGVLQGECTVWSVVINMVPLTRGVVITVVPWLSVFYCITVSLFLPIGLFLQLAHICRVFPITHSMLLFF